jgi:hypothetical protein
MDRNREAAVNTEEASFSPQSPDTLKRPTGTNSRQQLQLREDDKSSQSSGKSRLRISLSRFADGLEAALSGESLSSTAPTQVLLGSISTSTPNNNTNNEVTPIYKPQRADQSTQHRKQRRQPRPPPRPAPKVFMSGALGPPDPDTPRFRSAQSISSCSDCDDDEDEILEVLEPLSLGRGSIFEPSDGVEMAGLSPRPATTREARRAAIFEPSDNVEMGVLSPRPVLTQVFGSVGALFEASNTMETEPLQPRPVITQEFKRAGTASSSTASSSQRKVAFVEVAQTQRARGSTEGARYSGVNSSGRRRSKRDGRRNNPDSRGVLSHGIICSESKRYTVEQIKQLSRPSTKESRDGGSARR